ncbi:hypothetical protein GCM10022289_19200 [Pedobacter jeongneungensis]|uniref:Uncharacterized protein n=1 Tax=Pedobacter jeongneungensis TaxID=947309 RepID=A0ABP8BBZ5_9SPHI
MENVIELFKKESLVEFAADYNFCWHERETFGELVKASDENNVKQLDWFFQFGDRLRQILLNVYAYRKGLDFGFTEISFDEYGWFKRPVFLEQEELKFGMADKSRYGNYSSVILGHGPNGLWTYGMNMSYGTAGSASGLSVHAKIFPSRIEALNQALAILRSAMEEKVGDPDTTNYNQKVISATLMSIDELRFAKVQLSLF